MSDLLDISIKAPVIQQAKPSQSAQILSLCANLELFHTPDLELFASLEKNGHRENMSLKGSAFSQFLSHLFYQTFKISPNRQALQDAINVLSGRAHHEGLTHPVYCRLGEYCGKIYLDLGNHDWEAVEISATGWSVISDPPVKFRRSKGMLPLASPEKSDNFEALEELGDLLNLGSPDDRQLLYGWLLAAINPKGACPVLCLTGEQGSAKSTTAGLIRGLIDPNVAPLRGIPRNTDDLMLAARNGQIVALDNLSSIPPWLSDDLCRLSTGGGLSKRALYTDDEEILINVRRPILLTGIGDLITRSDLADRAIVLHLPSIPDTKRKTEFELLAKMQKISPKLLGYILNAAAIALRDYPATVVSQQVRMADFGKWVTAGEQGFGLRNETILMAYIKNQNEANDLILEHDLIASAIISIADKCWCGTATELLSRLGSFAPGDRDWRSWPSTPKGLSDILRRFAPNLRKVGVSIEWRKSAGSQSRRIISISRVQPLTVAFDASDAELTPKSKECVASVDGVSVSQASPSRNGAHAAKQCQDWMDLFEANSSVGGLK